MNDSKEILQKKPEKLWQVKKQKYKALADKRKIQEENKILKQENIELKQAVNKYLMQDVVSTAVHNISNLEDFIEINQHNESINVSDYEIASECGIAGILDYLAEDIKIRFSFLTAEPDQDGLYRYSIKVTINTNQTHRSKLSNIDNLLALLALYFGCRFFKLSCTSHEIKKLYHFNYNKCPKEFLPTIFDHFGDNQNPFQRNRIFDSELNNFLTKFDKLEADKSQKLLRACKFYLSALQEVGLNMYNYSYDGDGDHGRIMVYLKLVSSIEVLLPPSDKVKQKKELQGELFNDMRALLENSYHNPQLESSDYAERLEKFDDIKKQYEENLKEIEQGIARSFKNFIKKFKDNYEYLKPLKHKNIVSVYVSKKTLESVLHKIYDARSRYLHDAIPPILSVIQYGNNVDWHMHPYVDSQKIYLPYEWWFEALVRHCLLEYFKLEETTINKTEL